MDTRMFFQLIRRTGLVTVSILLALVALVTFVFAMVHR
jgi:hypothetical protein